MYVHCRTCSASTCVSRLSVGCAGPMSERKAVRQSTLGPPILLADVRTGSKEQREGKTKQTERQRKREKERKRERERLFYARSPPGAEEEVCEETRRRIREENSAAPAHPAERRTAEKTEIFLSFLPGVSPPPSLLFLRFRLEQRTSICTDHIYFQGGARSFLSY